VHVQRDDKRNNRGEPGGASRRILRFQIRITVSQHGSPEEPIRWSESNPLWYGCQVTSNVTFPSLRSEDSPCSGLNRLP